MAHILQLRELTAILEEEVSCASDPLSTTHHYAFSSPGNYYVAAKLDGG